MKLRVYCETVLYHRLSIETGPISALRGWECVADGAAQHVEALAGTR